MCIEFYIDNLCFKGKSCEECRHVIDSNLLEDLVCLEKYHTLTSFRLGKSLHIDCT